MLRRARRLIMGSSGVPAILARSLERIGEEYDGVISGITSFGIYVELPNTVEGLIHVSKLPGDFFRYDESRYEMVGDATGKSS